jgi:hypothetical protein
MGLLQVDYSRAQSAAHDLGRQVTIVHYAAVCLRFGRFTGTTYIQVCADNASGDVLLLTHGRLLGRRSRLVHAPCDARAHDSYRQTP